MQMYPIQLNYLFREKEMCSVTSLIYLVMVVLAALLFSAKFNGFLLLNSFVFSGHVTCRPPVAIVNG